MLATTSLHDIASSLAKTPHAFGEHFASPRRVLCLKLQGLPARGFRRPQNLSFTSSVVEAFLKYSPYVYSRASDPNKGAREDVFWVFIDIGSTSHLYHGEEGLMRSAQSLARDLGFSAQCAVADTPSGAQAFATSHHGTIVPHGEERERLKELSLPLILQLEGLQPWAKPAVIESIVTFFMMLGFRTVDDLSRFTLSSFQERWGEAGALLWKRLNAQDEQELEEFHPSSEMTDLIQLDFPVSLMSLLLHQMEKSIDLLFARLKGRRLLARKLVITLISDHVDAKTVLIEVCPQLASRHRNTFFLQLEDQLNQVSLHHSVSMFKIEAVTSPEIRQDLHVTEQSLRQQQGHTARIRSSTKSASGLRPGFYKIENSVDQIGRWQLQKSDRGSARAVRAGENFVPPLPEPTRALAEPVPLSLQDLADLEILPATPAVSNAEPAFGRFEAPRDYHFAVTADGKCLWIFQDLQTEEYFLHGYLD